METEIYSILFKAIWQKNCVSRLDHFGSLAKKKKFKGGSGVEFLKFGCY
jgi:hypothetical protein